MPTNIEMSAIAEDLLHQANSLGATEADVMVAEGTSISVQVRLSEIDRLSHAQEKSLGLRVFFGKRSAISSTSDFSSSSLKQFVSDTCSFAKAVAEDRVSGLPEPDSFTRDFPDLDVCDETVLSVEQEIDLARRAEDAARAEDARVTNSEGADCSVGHGSIMLANSHGFRGRHKSSSFSLSVSPIVTDQDTGSMQTDSWYSVKRKYALLDSPESIGKKATQRAIRKLGARKVGTQRVPVVYDQETAGSILGHIASAVSGYALYKGASFLLNELGNVLAPEFVSIIDDGRLMGGLGSRPFDGEGLATRRTMVMEAGTLTSYLLDTYSGRKLGFPSTGNASRGVGDSPTVSPTNLFFQPGSRSESGIISSISQGLYVTELIGFGVNMVTGDYSRGAAGFWIENGELAYPVEEVTIAGNLKTMLADIDMIGNNLEFRGRIASPTLKIREMTVAGN